MRPSRRGIFAALVAAFVFSACHAGGGLESVPLQPLNGRHLAARTSVQAANFGPLTGTITAVGTDQLTVKFGAGCGSTPVQTNANTQFSPQGAVPKTGTAATITGTGTCANPVTAVAVVLPHQLPAPAFTDWNTFGDSLARLGYNPNETTISSANANALQVAWAVDLGSAITAQPIVATNANVDGAKTVLYIGTEGGRFLALNAATGKTLWSRQLATVSTNCLDLPGGTFGVTGTATFDKATGRVYVADAKNNVHALDMTTGAEIAGWPVNIAPAPLANHVYGALTYNPANGLLYAETASMCDNLTWHGRIVAIDTATAAVVAKFFPAAPYAGAGIWGLGGASLDTASNDLYAATGNDVGAPQENSADGDHVIQFDANLNALAANDPGVGNGDLDFGATPAIVQAPGCPQQVLAKNKNGKLFDWDTASIGSGPVQSLRMASSDSNGQFIGVTAYSPVANLVYVGDPRGATGFTNGVIALAPQADCTLAVAWQGTAGPAAPFGANDNVTPSVGNGVVYLEDGINNTVYAYDAASGTPLWNSGTTIGGPTLGAPVIDGRLFVGSWDHKLYAYGVF